jgi:acetoacetate decarboxylase
MIPESAPLYNRFPWTYEDASILSVTFNGDYDALREWVPEPLEITPDATGEVWVSDAPVVGGGGGGREFLVAAHVSYEGTDGIMELINFVENDSQLASGREIAGMAKKMAESVEIENHGDQILGKASRSGVEVGTAGVALDEEGDEGTVAEVEAGMGAPIYNVKKIPSTEPNEYDTYNITETRMKGDVHRVISGRGFAEFQPSAVDPIYKLDPTPVEGAYVELDNVLPKPEVVVEGLTPNEV